MNDMQNSQPNSTDDLRRAVNWMMTGIDALGCPLRMLLHCRIGTQQPGMSGVVAFLMLVVITCQCRPQDARFMFAFTGLFLVMCFIRRADAFMRARRNDEEHSWFEGYSIIGRVLPRISDESAKKYVEPLIGFIMAVAASPLCPPLCLYLMAASFALMFMSHAKAGMQRRKLRRMRDSYLEQQSVAQSFRRYIDDGRL